MTITLQELFAALEAKNGFPLDKGQQEAISYGDGPLLIAAGPGTGKTEVLVTRCLKFICCDGVLPGSIMLTTFTEKAARNLEDRVAETFLSLARKYSSLAKIDLSDLRVGTLHSLCNGILQEYRYSDYQNLRLLDEMESALLIHKKVANNIENLKGSLFDKFGYLFGRIPFNKLSNWRWALTLQSLFDRLIQDQINLDRLETGPGAWASLYTANSLYEKELEKSYACDFARLLRHFRTFLDTGQGETFLKGYEGAPDVRPLLTHVLVDEYQDTNPVQESIYFRLCESSPHNITVVGDDDQALYRFRGGTVECMVGFPASCQSRWGATAKTIVLGDNYRSDSDIVEWCNKYIISFPQMTAPNVRIPGKPPLISQRGHTGSHPAVGLIHHSSVRECARDVAELIVNLKKEGIIEDYSQCVLLLRSAKNTPNFAGPYQTALEAQRIPVYNPRSKDYLEQTEVAQCLGAFVRIVDPDLTQIDTLMSQAIQELVHSWACAYDSIAPASPQLDRYVSEGANEIARKGTSERVTPAIPEIVYRILSHKPFTEYQTVPDMDLRLSKLTRLFESFCAQYGRALWTDGTIPGKLPGWWYGNFYYGLCGYLNQRGLDDDEDEEVVCPTGFFPIMTIHQAKGLEFDFVFVGNLGSSVKESNAHQLEQDLRRFRIKEPDVFHPIKESKWHDDIRQHFVAYSRAKYSLVLVASASQLRKKAHESASFGGEGGGWVRQNVPRL